MDWKDPKQVTAYHSAYSKEWKKRRRANFIGPPRPRHKTLKTHCVNGHEYSSENTSFDGATRRCRACCATRERYKYNKHPRVLPRTRTKAERESRWRRIGIIGFTLEDYESLYKKQEGLCANPACGREIRQYGTYRGAEGDACVDHDHLTGMVRGLLCRRCNLGLGFLGDNEQGVLGILSYLRKENK